MAVSDASYGRRLGWTVGVLDWLDNPASKVNRYWRVIEYGSGATNWPWVGKRIVGLWGPDAGGNERPGQLINGGQLDPFGDGYGQKFVPFFPALDTNLLRAGRAALWYLFDGGKANLDLLHGGSPSENKRIFFWLMTRATIDQMPFVQGVVQKPIEAKHYYELALGEFQPVQVEMDLIRDVLRSFFRGTGSLDTLRAQVSAETGAFPGQPARTGARRTESRDVSEFAPMSIIPSVSASSTLQDLIRTGSGSFSVVQGEIEEVNRRVAAAFQAVVVRQMTESALRPATGDLVRATEDRRNRYPQ